VGGLSIELEGRHEVVLRMFNDRSTGWEVTDDRIDALALIPSGLEEKYAVSIADMVDTAVEGARRWGMTTERFLALRQYLVLIRAPSVQTIKDVIQQMQLGGIRDGVADRDWFLEAVKMLLAIEESKK
jgi:hypothetical protein